MKQGEIGSERIKWFSLTVGEVFQGVGYAPNC